MTSLIPIEARLVFDSALVSRYRSPSDSSVHSSVFSLFASVAHMLLIRLGPLLASSSVAASSSERRRGADRPYVRLSLISLSAVGRWECLK